MTKHKPIKAIQGKYSSKAFTTAWPQRIDHSLEVKHLYRELSFGRLLASHEAELKAEFGPQTGHYSLRPYWCLEHNGNTFFVFSSKNNGGTSIEMLLPNGEEVNGPAARAFVEELVVQVPGILK